MKVLEIGTGTGYNAAMLAEIVGSSNVTTLEVDPTIADHARDALRSEGFPVTVVTGDGAEGYAENAPYDRVIATAAVQRIPHGWVAQSRPGGRIVAPWASAFDPGGVLVTLTVLDGVTAEGRFGPDVGFMYLREQRPTPVPWVDDEREHDYLETQTGTDITGMFGDDQAAIFAIGARIPGLMRGQTIGQNGLITHRLSHHPSDSWASFTAGPTSHTVRQHGPRRLWDELEAAYKWWVKAGKPQHTHFGTTVTPGEQRIWLDTPENVLSIL